MKSPFPGMDPYLEAHWRDVHRKLVTYIADSLQPQLPGDLAARTEERIYVHSEIESKGYRGLYPEVRVIQTEPLEVELPLADSSVAVMEPVIVELDNEPRTEGYVQIIDLSTDDVVTVIEVLSPTNKDPGDGSRQYLQKQAELLGAHISIVEIDLIRAGKWVVRAPKHRLNPAFHTTFRVCVTKGWETHLAKYYPIRLADPLPAIKIPLREKDEAVTLELQPLIEQAYRNGGYGGMDYRKPLRPPLFPGEAVWVDELLKAVGK